VNWQQTWNPPWRRALFGALVCAAATWLAEQTVLYDALANASYDWTFFFRPPTRPDDVLLIYMDDESSMELPPQDVTWDRAMHAELIERLHGAGAKLVVFDVTFPDERTPAGDRRLAEALQRFGPVVIAGDIDAEQRRGLSAGPVGPPAPMFERAAAGWGIAATVGPEGETVRRYHPGTDREPPLPWAAARALNPQLPPAPFRELESHWLNYYGPPGHFRWMSYKDARNPAQPAETFAGKCIFIGARFNTPYPRIRRDEFSTPYTLWLRSYTPGVDLAATAFLNLIHHEWLTRLDSRTEEGALAGLALLIGFLLGCLRFPFALGTAVLLALGSAAGGVLGTAHLHVWTPWLLVPVVQLPAALVWVWLARRLASSAAAAAPAPTSSGQAAVDRLDSPTVIAQRQPVAPPSPGSRVAPAISDHVMLRCIGRGAYGEVWLARDMIGSFHAVKVIHRSSFDSQTPFEREYHGMQKFTPLSRNHPGWIHVLHVGRNDAEGYFFYVMELADDETTGQEIDPDHYQPRTLANELQQRGRLPLKECLDLGIALADALDYLHGQLLVHRDIKPSNVIYVHGAPKFTDVGLVTEVRNRDRDVSMLGTEGYMAPEGPGAAAADIYSLGKLLYEISTGRDRFAFPALPESMVEAGEAGWGSRWVELIRRACHEDPRQRHRSAAELKEDLLRMRDHPPDRATSPPQGHDAQAE